MTKLMQMKQSPPNSQTKTGISASGQAVNVALHLLRLRQLRTRHDLFCSVLSHTKGIFVQILRMSRREHVLFLSLKSTVPDYVTPLLNAPSGLHLTQNKTQSPCGANAAVHFPSRVPVAAPHTSSSVTRARPGCCPLNHPSSCPPEDLPPVAPSA